MNNVVQVSDFFFKKLAKNKVEKLKNLQNKCESLSKKLPEKNLSLSEIPVMIAICECEELVELVASGATKKQIKNHLNKIGDIFAKED